jgi:hypothetical protein
LGATFLRIGALAPPACAEGESVKLNVQGVGPVDEVNMFMDDGKVLHFQRPTGQSPPRPSSGSEPWHRLRAPRASQSTATVPREWIAPSLPYDKKLQTALKKLNVQGVGPVDEVNMFMDDGKVLHRIGALAPPACAEGESVNCHCSSRMDRSLSTLPCPAQAGWSRR